MSAPGRLLRSRRLRAHHTTSFREAWAEAPRTLCKLGWDPFEVEMSAVTGEGTDSGLLLSEIGPSVEVRRALSRAVRSPIVIAEGARRTVEALHQYRATISDIAAMVFCGNDDDREDRAVNKHARQIKKALLVEDPALEVVVATSAEGGGTADVEAFVAGRGDVLIVKQMAGVGLDVERAKITLDLSAVRQEASCSIQRWLRVATPYREIPAAKVILPHENIGQAIFDGLTAGTNGAATKADLAFLHAHEVPRADPRDRTIYEVDATADADFDDSERNHGFKEQAPIVAALLEIAPTLIAYHTAAELATMFAGWTPPASAASGDGVSPRDTGGELELLYAQINELGDEITEARLRAGGYPEGEYGEIRTQAFVDAYRHAGVRIGTDLRQIRSLKTLEAIKYRLRCTLSETRATAGYAD